MLMCCRAGQQVNLLSQSRWPQRPQAQSGGLSDLRRRLLPTSPPSNKFAPYAPQPLAVPTAGSEDSKESEASTALEKVTISWWIISDRVSRRTGDTEAPKEMSAQEGLSERRERSCQ